MEKLFNTIFPAKCLFCNESGTAFCYSCLQACKVLNENFCIVCDKPSLDGATHSLCFTSGVPLTVFSPFIYEGLVRECIHRSKYMQHEFAALTILAKESCAYASKIGVKYDDYVVVPIPLSSKRIGERGFNQSLLIAKELALVFKLHVKEYLLKRKLDTLVQAGLNREDRKLNMQNAFVAAENVKDKSILLVDDITTTGATFLAASRALYARGVARVSCFALAKKL